MKLIEKMKAKRFEKYWKRQGSKNLYTWVHRYLRLHSELLADSVYQNLYDYCRNVLIEYLKKDTNPDIDNVQLGETIDVLTDVFNETEAEQVDKFKVVVDELYELWKNNPNVIN